jgi:guanine deaminase
LTLLDSGELLRAPVFHTPRNPFLEEKSLECHWDGGLLIRAGRVAACGDYSTIHGNHPAAKTVDLRGGFLLPGFIDTHVHYPQLRVIGNMGRSLRDWLDRCALPEEARMADPRYARDTACQFVRALAAHGTTTAMVFGSHFAPATAELFEAATATGPRIVSGLVLSDRRLREDLHQTPELAYRESCALIRRFHGQGRLRYAVSPRFAVSASEAMLEVCQSLLREHPGLRVQTHLNENLNEIAEVRTLFPWASDYLAVYERFGLVSSRAVLAHNVHPTGSEIERLAATGATIAHCPSSNAALGSGLFPMQRHIAAGVRCALGTDVGAGTGFSMLKEALQAYLLQRVAPEGLLLDPARLLYLATRAGALALGIDAEVGDFQPDKSADLVYIRPTPESPLAAIVDQAENPERVLSALFTLAGPENISEVRVEGGIIYRR